MTTIRGTTHNPSCPVLNDADARDQYRLYSITLGQGGCPFCSMSTLTETDLETIKATIRRASRRPTFNAPHLRHTRISDIVPHLCIYTNPFDWGDQMHLIGEIKSI